HGPEVQRHGRTKRPAEPARTVAETQARQDRAQQAEADKGQNDGARADQRRHDDPMAPPQRHDTRADAAGAGHAQQRDAHERQKIRRKEQDQGPQRARQRRIQAAARRSFHVVLADRAQRHTAAGYGRQLLHRSAMRARDGHRVSANNRRGTAPWSTSVVLTVSAAGRSNRSAAVTPIDRTETRVAKKRVGEGGGSYD